MTAAANVLRNGRDGLPVLVLAHGAGAPMDSPFMESFATGLATLGIQVRRFEFSYMSARRVTGKRTPPPRAERLIAEYQAVVSGIDAETVFIGGKSMGGRVASMLADDAFAAGRIAGLICLGYPFHPPGKPDKLRTAHLQAMMCPALIVQGENDPFGTRRETDDFALSENISFHWAPHGNHDLVPPKRTGLSAEQNWQGAMSAIIRYICKT